MSPRIGPLNYAEQQEQTGPMGARPYSSATGRIIDEEVRTGRARTGIPTQHRARALRVLGPDRKTVAAGERD